MSINDTKSFKRLLSSVFVGHKQQKNCYYYLQKQNLLQVKNDMQENISLIYVSYNVFVKMSLLSVNKYQ